MEQIILNYTIIDKDGHKETISLENYKSISECRNVHEWEHQAYQIHKDILETIPEHLIESYAEWELNMIDKDDCEECEDCNNLIEFSDEELSKELFSRKTNNSLVQQDLLERFYNLLGYHDINLEEDLKELEIKYRGY
jgi:bifunctional DNA-binding transcriptional regulator/antitoxin component of YhaV-PrlF toxin-antitoxin module